MGIVRIFLPNGKKENINIMKRKLFLLSSFILLGVCCLSAQTTIQFKTVKQVSHYITNTTGESAYGDGRVYNGLKFETEFLWPIGGLPANKLRTFRQCVLRACASEQVTRAQMANVDEANFPNLLHAALVKEYRTEGVCMDSDQKLHYVTAAKLPKNVELSESVIKMEHKRTKNGVCTMFFHGWDFCIGAAHGMHGTWALNYDINANKQLFLRDLLQSGKAAEINRSFCAIVNRWRNTNGYSDYDEPYNEPRDFNDKYGWYMNNEGIVFLFQPYEIAPFSEGVVEITLPVKRYKYLFRPEALKYWNL